MSLIHSPPSHTASPGDDAIIVVGMIKVSEIGKDHENRFDGLMMWENLRGKVEAKPSVGGKQQPSDIKRMAMEIIHYNIQD